MMNRKNRKYWIITLLAVMIAGMFHFTTPSLVVEASEIEDATDIVAISEDENEETTENRMTLTAEGSENQPAVVVNPVAKVGTVEYATLQEAIDAAGHDATVVVTANITLDGPVTIAADDVITLDLNGNTISAVESATGSFGLINVVKGNLTVMDYVGTGKITLKAENNRGWGAYSSVISNQQGTVTIVGGTIEHLGGTDMAYAVDNLTNGGIGDAVLNINGGNIISTYRAIRQFANSATHTNYLNVCAGKITSTSGNKGAIWLQSANASANKAVLNIKGGDISSIYVDVEAGFDAAGIIVSIPDNYLAKTTIEVVSANCILKAADGSVRFFTSLQDAINAANAAGGNQTVTVWADVLAEDVTVYQTVGSNITIDGNGKTYTGTITVHGGSRYTDETLTIQNFNFYSTEESHDFISSDDVENGSLERYAHNVTVQNCTFTGGLGTVGVRIYQGKNLTFKNITANGLHSLAQLKATHGKVYVENVKIEGGKSGIALGTSFDAEIKNSTIHANTEAGYGVRADVSGNNSVLTVENCEITGFIPVLVRDAKDAAHTHTVNVNGTNTLSGPGYSVAATAGDYDEKTALVMPIAEVVVSVNGTGLTADQIYPNVVAQVGIQKYESLQEAINAATLAGKNQTVVVRAAELAEDVNVYQTEGSNITIDGNGATYTGTITVHGGSRYTDETLTIQNFNFYSAEESHDFISSDNVENGSYERYAHNVTVQDCTFTGGIGVVGVRIYQGKNLTFKNITANGLHSLAQLKATSGKVLVDNVKIENGKSGIALGTSYDVEIKNSTISANTEAGYGIRGDFSGNNSVLTVENCNITAYYPVIMRKGTSGTYTLNVTGTNTMNYSNNSNCWAVATAGDDDEALAAPSVAFKVAIMDKNLNIENVYPRNTENVTKNFVLVNDKAYANFDEAAEYAVAENGEVNYYVYGKVIVTGTNEKYTPNLASCGADIVNVIGVTEDATLTLDGVYYQKLGANGATLNVKGMTLADRRRRSGEGSDPDPWEFCYIGFDCAKAAFTDCTFLEGVLVAQDAKFKNCLFTMGSQKYEGDDTEYNTDHYGLWIHNYGNVEVDGCIFKDMTYGAIKSTWNKYNDKKNDANLTISVVNTVFSSVAPCAKTPLNLDGAVFVKYAFNEANGFAEGPVYKDIVCDTPETKIYVKDEPEGVFDGRSYLDVKAGRVYANMKSVSFSKSVELKLYSGSTLLATASLNTEEHWPGVKGALTGSVSVDPENWSDTWICKSWDAKTNKVPTKMVLVIDGVVMDESIIAHTPNDNEPITADDWKACPGVTAPAPVVTPPAPSYGGGGFVPTPSVTPSQPAEEEDEKTEDEEKSDEETEEDVTIIEDEDVPLSSFENEEGLKIEADEETGVNYVYNEENEPVKKQFVTFTKGEESVTVFTSKTGKVVTNRFVVEMEDGSTKVLKKKELKKMLKEGKVDMNSSFIHFAAEDGVILTNGKIKIGNKIYKFDENGVLVKVKVKVKKAKK